MKIRGLITLFVLMHLKIGAQSVESKLQAMIDSIYASYPASVGLMLHVESPERGLSWSGASGYSDKDARNNLEPDQPALIASNIKTYVSASILCLSEQGKLSIDQPIGPLLSKKTRLLFSEDGYDLDAITIKHLLSHTSGIQDYANEDYIDFIDQNKAYRWTRDEQLALTIQVGDPIGNPGDTFNYADANYLLLTEIIEQLTQKPFYEAMRELLNYEALGLIDTWMPTLEKKPAQTKAMVHQYWGEKNWDAYDIDVSVDLYGGGGIACTTRDLSNFLYDLFNGQVIKDTAAFSLLFTVIPTKDPEPSQYYLGIASYDYRGMRAYGHSGFWGTIGVYLPEIKTSIAVFVLDRDERGLRREIINQTLDVLVE